MHEQKRLRSLEDLKDLLPGDPTPARPGTESRGTPPGPQGKGRVLHLRLETGGRKGKAVTVITGLQDNPRYIEDLARALKQFCGAGGTVKQGVIEVQGDQRERATSFLRDRGFVIR